MGIALAATGLAGCGGGGGSASSSSGAITSVGTITGFGSIYVNGVKYETDSASYRVDDEDYFDDSSVAVGMKVKVEGKLNPDGKTGTATSVYYDDDVEGPIDPGSITLATDANSKTFTIFGLEIMAHISDTVYDDGASFDALADGQVLEISGYFDGTQIVATRIEKQSDLDDEFELKGTVSNYDGSNIALVLQNGANAGPYPIDGSAELEIPADPTDLFVEIKLVDQAGTLFVTKIEQDDEDLLDDSDSTVSIQGIVTDDGEGGFMVNGIPFQTNDNTEYSPSSLEGTLSADMEVEVEGIMQDGILIAYEIETEDGDIEMQARVIGVTATDSKNGEVTLDMGNGQSLTVITDNSTQFEDKSSNDLNGDESFNLDELAIDTDYVEVEAYHNDSNQLVATSIQREDGGQDTRLEGPVVAVDPYNSVTILDITYTVSGSTSYEVYDLPSDAAGFFGTVAIDNTIQVKDTQPNGQAEELDLEN
jgi:hypothetical protein